MIDYKKLGFKAGLEIHQQLDTHKLFCSCPSVLRNDSPSFKVNRKFHKISGESGEVDVAAKYQHSLNKDFFYEGYDTTCLVELDEEPPHEINKEALKIALEISCLLNCEIVPLSQVMRKTVINGSNTSGFQRSVMVARGGYIETSEGKVGIDSVYLEEDSARPVHAPQGVPPSSRVGGKKDSVTYRLDRLGIPLVEISTMPDLKNAKHVKEAALKIGEILRSCKVRRGIGTIRQDLNISIKGSNRVEVKGFQDPKIMETCVDLEVLRQKEFLDKKKVNDSEVRNCLPDGKTEFIRPMPGADRMYPETDLPLLRISRDFLNEVKKNLPKLKGDIEEDLRKQGLSDEVIKMIFKTDKLELYKDLYELNGNPRLISKVLFLLPKEIAKKEKMSLEEVENILNRDVLVFILDSVYREKVHEGDLKMILEKIVRGENVKTAIKIEKKDLVDVEERILKIIREKPGLNANAYMGLVMKEMKGAISGGDAMEIIKKLTK
jgi:Glu-tRNA(Gln) amidotransferase subunit E-like FAD-binding protein